MRLRSATLGLAVFFVLLGFACTGDDPDVVDPGASSGGTSSGAGTSTSSSGTGTSSSGSTSSSGGSDASSCVPGCKNASTFSSCTAPDEVCQFGCVTTPAAHCQRAYPKGLMTPEMISLPDTGEITLPTLRANVLTGEMSNNVRKPNGDPAKLEVISGIGFQRVDKGDGHPISIWMFKSLLVPQTATVHFSNANAVGFAVATTATILGVVDVRPYNSSGVLCGTETISAQPYVVGGPGGAPAVFAGLNSGPGAGTSASTSDALGAGGGGFGGEGMKGGPGLGAAGGPTYGNATLSPLIGGSGGGSALTISGGGGGGAIHLFAGVKLVIGDGSNIGGVNAGGCAGRSSQSATARAGAGGSGGAILVETPSLDLNGKSGLAANGGNGGEIGTAAAPEAPISNSPTYPATTGTGAGGAGSQYGGGNATYYNGTGTAGGGAVGRIRLHLKTASFTVPPAAVLSPSPITTNSATTFDKVDIH